MYSSNLCKIKHVLSTFAATSPHSATIARVFSSLNGTESELPTANSFTLEPTCNGAGSGSVVYFHQCDNAKTKSHACSQLDTGGIDDLMLQAESVFPEASDCSCTEFITKDELVKIENPMSKLGIDEHTFDVNNTDEKSQSLLVKEKYEHHLKSRCMDEIRPIIVTPSKKLNRSELLQLNTIDSLWNINTEHSDLEKHLFSKLPQDIQDKCLVPTYFAKEGNNETNIANKCQKNLTATESNTALQPSISITEADCSTAQKPKNKCSLEAATDLDTLSEAAYVNTSSNLPSTSTEENENISNVTNEERQPFEENDISSHYQNDISKLSSQSMSYKPTDSLLGKNRMFMDDMCSSWAPARPAVQEPGEEPLAPEDLKMTWVVIPSYYTDPRCQPDRKSSLIGLDLQDINLNATCQNIKNYAYASFHFKNHNIQSKPRKKEFTGPATQCFMKEFVKKSNKDCTKQHKSQSSYLKANNLSETLAERDFERGSFDDRFLLFIQDMADGKYEDMASINLKGKESPKFLTGHDLGKGNIDDPFLIFIQSMAAGKPEGFQSRERANIIPVSTTLYPKHNSSPDIMTGHDFKTDTFDDPSFIFTKQMAREKSEDFQSKDKASPASESYLKFEASTCLDTLERKSGSTKNFRAKIFISHTKSYSETESMKFDKKSAPKISEPLLNSKASKPELESIPTKSDKEPTSASVVPEIQTQGSSGDKTLLESALSSEADPECPRETALTPKASKSLNKQMAGKDTRLKKVEKSVGAGDSADSKPLVKNMLQNTSCVEPSISTAEKTFQYTAKSNSEKVSNKKSNYFQYVTLRLLKLENLTSIIKPVTVPFLSAFRKKMKSFAEPEAVTTKTIDVDSKCLNARRNIQYEQETVHGATDFPSTIPVNKCEPKHNNSSVAASEPLIPLHQLPPMPEKICVASETVRTTCQTLDESEGPTSTTLVFYDPHASIFQSAAIEVPPKLHKTQEVKLENYNVSSVKSTNVDKMSEGDNSCDGAQIVVDCNSNLQADDVECATNSSLLVDGEAKTKHIDDNKTYIQKSDLNRNKKITDVHKSEVNIVSTASTTHNVTTPMETEPVIGIQMSSVNKAVKTKNIGSDLEKASLLNMQTEEVPSNGPTRKNNKETKSQTTPPIMQDTTADDINSSTVNVIPVKIGRFDQFDKCFSNFVEVKTGTTNFSNLDKHDKSETKPVGTNNSRVTYPHKTETAKWTVQIPVEAKQTNISESQSSMLGSHENTGKFNIAASKTKSKSMELMETKNIHKKDWNSSYKVDKKYNSYKRNLNLYPHKSGKTKKNCIYKYKTETMESKHQASEVSAEPSMTDVNDFASTASKPDIHNITEKQATPRQNTSVLKGVQHRMGFKFSSKPEIEEPTKKLHCKLDNIGKHEGKTKSFSSPAKLNSYSTTDVVESDVVSSNMKSQDTLLAEPSCAENRLKSENRKQHDMMYVSVPAKTKLTGISDSNILNIDVNKQCVQQVGEQPVAGSAKEDVCYESELIIKPKFDNSIPEVAYAKSQAEHLFMTEAAECGGADNNKSPVTHSESLLTLPSGIKSNNHMCEIVTFKLDSNSNNASSTIEMPFINTDSKMPKAEVLTTTVTTTSETRTSIIDCYSSQLSSMQTTESLPLEYTKITSEHESANSIVDESENDDDDKTFLESVDCSVMSTERESVRGTSVDKIRC